MISRMLDRLSNFIAHRKGLLPLIGLAMVAINLIIQLVFPFGHWLQYSNLFLHAGIIVAVLGFMLAWAL